MRRLATAIILASLLIPGSAFAQQSTHKAQKKTTYTFVPEDIGGTRVVPDDTIYGYPITHSQPHLIHVRPNFTPELIKSVEEL